VPPPSLAYVGAWGRLKLQLGPAAAQTVRQLLFIALFLQLGARAALLLGYPHTTVRAVAAALQLLILHPLVTRPRLSRALLLIALGRASSASPGRAAAPPGLRFELSELRDAEAQRRAARLLCSPAFQGRGESAARALLASADAGGALLPPATLLLEVFAVPLPPRRRAASAADEWGAAAAPKAPVSQPQPNRLLGLLFAHVAPRVATDALQPLNGPFSAPQRLLPPALPLLVLSLGAEAVAGGAAPPAWFPAAHPADPGHSGTRPGALLAAAVAALLSSSGCFAALLPPEPAGLPDPLQRLHLLSRGAHALPVGRGAPADTHCVLVPDELRGSGSIEAYARRALPPRRARKLLAARRRWARAGGCVRALSAEALAGDPPLLRLLLEGPTGAPAPPPAGQLAPAAADEAREPAAPLSALLSAPPASASPSALAALARQLAPPAGGAPLAWALEARAPGGALVGGALLGLDSASGALRVRSWALAQPLARASGASLQLALACLELALVLPRCRALELGPLEGAAAEAAARTLAAVRLPRTPLLLFADDRLAAAARVPSGSSAHALPPSLCRGMLAAAMADAPWRPRHALPGPQPDAGLLSRRAARRLLRQGKAAERRVAAGLRQPRAEEETAREQET